MPFRWATLALCFSLPALAQDASVTGLIRDITGAPISGADVKVRSRNTNEIRSIRTGETGQFTIAELNPDTYEITVEKAGFKLLRESGLELEVDQTARLDLKLDIGSVEDSVEVKAESPVLNTESAARGAVITSREMVEVPLDGRDFGDLVFLVTGVGRKAQNAQGSNFSVNGTRSDNVNFVIDGFNDRNPRGGGAEARPNLDAMQEFKVQTTGYPAEYGRLAGGVVNMVLKSGTNDVHGALFEFVRNDLLDARTFFDAKKSELRRNQFGATVGGPVYLPRIYHGRNRSFFLFSWESSRQVLGMNRIGVVPTLPARTGDFSSAKDPLGNPILLHDPLAAGTCDTKSKAACFPGNKIPANRLDGVAGRVLPYYPFPNRMNAQNNFQINKLQDDDFNSFLFRIDHTFSMSNTLSARYLIRPTFSVLPFASGDTGQFGNITRLHQHLAGLTYTRLLSSVLVNEARLGFSRTTEDDHAVSAGIDYASRLGIPGTATDPRFVGFPLFTISGQSTIGDAAGQPLQYAVTNYEFADTLTLSKGSHLLKWAPMRSAAIPSRLSTIIIAAHSISSAT
ncbi:MAG: carboxypeptidase regulatory-like domain-containing protein [Acidobacteriota bacterium]|nr:carboxypeptidase regulatory-like domain-containing protein [Acidobacteriota bacterium]